MNYKFAKLYDIEEYQVLVTKTYFEREDQYSITETTDLGALTTSREETFQLEEDRDCSFEAYSIEHARKFLQSCHVTLSQIEVVEEAAPVCPLPPAPDQQARTCCCCNHILPDLFLDQCEKCSNDICYLCKCPKCESPTS